MLSTVSTATDLDWLSRGPKLLGNGNASKEDNINLILYSFDSKGEMGEIREEVCGNTSPEGGTFETQCLEQRDVLREERPFEVRK